MTDAHEIELRQQIEELRQQNKEVTLERNTLHAQLTDLRLRNIEDDITELKITDGKFNDRITPLEASQIKANTIYALFAGNGLLSLIALVKIFNVIP